MIRDYLAHYRRLTRSNRILVLVLIALALCWPLVIGHIPVRSIQSFFAGIAFAGSILGLLYFGEQKE